MKRRELEKQARIELIVSQAMELFDEKGFANTTMENIAQSSELSKPTLYKYFISKDEIALKAYQKIHKMKREVLKRYVQRGKSGREKLFLMAKGFKKFYEENNGALKFQLEWDYNGLRKDKVRPEILEEVIKYFDDDTAFIDEIYSSGIKDGTLRKDMNARLILDNYYLLLRSTLNQQLFMSDDKKWIGALLVQNKKKFEYFVEVYLDGLKP